eukprot:TRINITY_DN2860_c0_g1_i1.p1 TRINITY_DN2860_c0_g1~~TRINITY_DN2860_c0_g1_i1.p1  ORF type:complete len:674 (-),score=212.57 TRINITY_DN2860_c0_g1_i1:1993-4014(-)
MRSGVLESSFGCVSLYLSHFCMCSGSPYCLIFVSNGCVMENEEGMKHHENDLLKGFSSFTGLVVAKDNSSKKRHGKLGSRSLSCSSSSDSDDDIGEYIVYDDESHEEKAVSHSSSKKKRRRRKEERGERERRKEDREKSKSGLLSDDSSDSSNGKRKEKKLDKKKKKKRREKRGKLKAREAKNVSLRGPSASDRIKIAEIERTLRSRRNPPILSGIEKGAISSVIVPSTLHDEDLFFYDMEGDIENLIFKKAYEKSTPLYRRIVQFDSKMQEDGERYFKKRWRSTTSMKSGHGLEHLKGKFESWSAQSTNWGEEDGFVPFLTVSSDAAEDSESREKRVLELEDEFKVRLELEPKNISLWINYVQFLKEYLPFHGKERIVLERGLEKNPSSAELKVLQIQMLCDEWEKEHSVDPARKSTPTPDMIWERVLGSKQFYGNLIMWKEYLRYKLNKFSELNMSAIRDVYSDAVRSMVVKKKSQEIIMNRLQMQMSESREVVDVSDIRLEIEDCKNRIFEIDRDMIDLFLQVCRFERKSGHEEVVISMVQAMLELNFFCPAHIMSWEEQFLGFAGFWESEKPRIGEEGAEGWKKYDSFGKLISDQSPTQPKSREAEGTKQVGLSLDGDMGRSMDADADVDVNDEVEDWFNEMIESGKIDSKAFLSWAAEETVSNTTKVS